jgi:hypothetical protein
MSKGVNPWLDPSYPRKRGDIELITGAEQAKQINKLMSEETTNPELTPEEAYQAMVQQIYDNIDPREFLTPTQRVVAYMSMEELEEEYKLVQAKKSTRSRMQRDLIEDRWVYEQKMLAEQEKEESNESESDIS